MKFYVMDTVACPKTGTFFTCLISEMNEKTIMWSMHHERFLICDDIAFSKNNAILLRTKMQIEILMLRDFNSVLWKSICDNCHCPGNSLPPATLCGVSNQCIFKVCPYGLSKCKNKQG